MQNFDSNSSRINIPVSRRLPLLALTSLASLVALVAAGPAQASPWHEDATNNHVDSDVYGDFNDDGDLDRVVVLPNYDAGRGLVAILWGTGDAQDYTYYRSGPPANSQIARKYWMDAQLGGIPGVPNYNGLPNSTRIDLEGATAAAAGVISAPWTHLGSSVAVGDFDGDSYDDLVIGVPGAELPKPGSPGQWIFNAGQVWVLYGSDMANGNFVPQVWHQNSPGILNTSESADYFGEVVTTGDVNCDGRDDLIVGVPRENMSSIVDSGVVHVLYGSNTGIVSTGNQLFYQGYNGVPDTSEAHDHFGAALATGSFNAATFGGYRECASLAIGAPGEDVSYGGADVSNAGVVHVLYAANYPAGGIWNGVFAKIGAAGQALFHQNTGSLKSAPEANDQFGASLGKVGGIARVGAPRHDDLWVGVPGENWSCPAPNRGTTHILKGGSSGLLTNNDELLCQSVRPDLAAAEAGVVVEKSDAHGKWLQYVPAGVNPSTAELMIVAHGTSDSAWALDAQEGETFTASRGNANYYLSFDGWIAAAEELNLIVIVPEFEEWNFGNTSTYTSGTAGGYRSLYGDELGANRWIERIADRYAEVGLGDGKFYLIGQSAGAQFTNRYTMHNNDRLLGAAFMSPGGVTLPDVNVGWPSGLGPYTGSSAWALANPVTPNPASAQLTLATVPVYYVVGERETPLIDPNSPDRVGKAQEWVAEVASEWGVQVPLCIIENGKHSGKSSHRSALVGLFPELDNHPVFASRPDCL